MKFGLSNTLAKKIGRRYSQALFNEALHQNLIEKVNIDVLSITETLKNSPDLKAFICDPHNPEDLSQAVLNDIFKGRVEPLTFDFLLLLIKKGRLLILGEVLDTFNDLYHAYHRVTKVEIISAVELSTQQVEAICKKLQDRHRHGYFAITTVDPSLIGGFQVKAGDEVLDYSMKAQLDNYRRQVINA